MFNKKIVFIVHKLEDASSRHRIFPVYEEMKRQGYDCRLSRVPNGFGGRVSLLSKLCGTDVLVLHRKFFKPIELFLIKKLCRKIIYDFDDALMFVEVRRNQPLTGKYTDKFARTAGASDIVVAGNAFLAIHSKLNCRRVEVLTTPVDVKRYVPAADRSEKKEVVIGWIGSKGNLVYLRDLEPVFKNLARKFPQMALSVICDDFLDVDGVKVYKRTWSEEDEIRYLQEIDIGIMPLTDDLWSRGKCGFKILEYFGVGVPAVASSVGINSEIIRHGVNGYLAGSLDEWEKHLGTLIEDAALRKNMGKEGRKTVEGRYSMEEYLTRYCLLINGLMVDA